MCVCVRERERERERESFQRALSFSCECLMNGSGDSSVVERRARDRMVPGSSPRRSGGRENCLLQGQLSVLTLIPVYVPPLCYRSNT